MRDIWEHFDEYVVGKGQLQDADRPGIGVGGQRLLGTYVWTGSPEDLGSLQWAGVVLSFDAAVSEAERLYAALRTSPLRPWSE